MEIKKAIERLKNTDIYNLGHNDRFEELRLYENAIDTVLKELNNLQKEKEEYRISWCNEGEKCEKLLEELNNRIPKEKIRNYLDTRINIVIDDKLNSKDKIQIATDEGIEKLLKMIRQDLLEDKE